MSTSHHGTPEKSNAQKDQNEIFTKLMQIVFNGMDENVVQCCIVFCDMNGNESLLVWTCEHGYNEFNLISCLSNLSKNQSLKTKGVFLSGNYIYIYIYICICICSYIDIKSGMYGISYSRKGYKCH